MAAASFRPVADTLGEEIARGRLPDEYGSGTDRVPTTGVRKTTAGRCRRGSGDLIHGRQTGPRRANRRGFRCLTSPLSQRDRYARCPSPERVIDHLRSLVDRERRNAANRSTVQPRSVSPASRSSTRSTQPWIRLLPIPVSAARASRSASARSAASVTPAVRSRSA